MRLAVMQARAEVLDVPGNLLAVTRTMEQAAQAGADLLVTPELFLTGYAPRPVREHADLAEVDRAVEAVREHAARLGLAVVLAVPQAAGDGSWQIVGMLIDGTGRQRLRYAKVHLFGPDEAAAFAPAEAAPGVVDLLGARVSMVICYDVEFPETVRAACAAGAEVVLVPTAMSEGFPQVSQVLLRARALENHAVVAYANHAGPEDGIVYDGGSVVAGPRGRDLARAGEHPELLLADVDLEDLRAARAQIPYLDQRRPEVYSRWARA